MKKEIKIRKKRFVAFWAVALLVCSLVGPIVVKAADRTIADTAYNDTMSVGDTIMHTLNTCTVTYWGYNEETDSVGEMLYSVEVAANETHTVIDYNGALPAGMKFSHWLVTDVLASGNDPASLSLTAQFIEGSSYTITFDSDGGSFVSDITLVEGTDITPPDDPTKDGFTFDGWEPELPATMPAENITVTAKWKSKYLIEKGTHELTAGVRYQLGSGVTRVSGDTSVYASGSYFYVPADDTYTFQ